MKARNCGLSQYQLTNCQAMETLKGKRIGALDFGLKRIGFAVCDELHIVVSPRGFFENTPELWQHLAEAFAKERLGAVVVGVPYRTDGTRTNIIDAVERFVDALRSRTALPVLTMDEAFSSRGAVQTMVRSGVKKKRRAEKGRTDAVAAAIILRDFLEELR
jgi:putative Holliday junction resolvase